MLGKSLFSHTCETLEWLKSNKQACGQWNSECIFMQYKNELVECSSDKVYRMISWFPKKVNININDCFNDSAVYKKCNFADGNRLLL